MELIKAVILGIVQGVTEFLPISSSGHLVIGSELLNFGGQGVTFDIFVHLGTLFSVVLVFRSELAGLVTAPFKYLRGQRDEQVIADLRWDGYIIIATIPAVIAGLAVKDVVEHLFNSLWLVFSMLFVTGVLMIVSRSLRFRGVKLGGRQALIIGVAQALAIFPGLSRSGSTIFAGMALGLERQLVARFSFIMSIPAILGAVVLQLSDITFSSSQEISFGMLVAGTIAAAASGYFAIILLLDIVQRNRLQWFGYYCLLLSCSGGLYLLV